MKLQLPSGCYVAELTLRLVEPDCCTTSSADCRLRVAFLDGGGGHYPQITEASYFAGDEGHLATLDRFLAAISKANDAAVADYYEMTTRGGEE